MVALCGKHSQPSLIRGAGRMIGASCWLGNTTAPNTSFRPTTIQFAISERIKRFSIRRSYRKDMMDAYSSLTASYVIIVTSSFSSLPGMLRCSTHILQTIPRTLLVKAVAVLAPASVQARGGLRRLASSGAGIVSGCLTGIMANVRCVRCNTPMSSCSLRFI